MNEIVKKVVFTRTGIHQLMTDFLQGPSSHFGVNDNEFVVPGLLQYR